MRPFSCAHKRTTWPQSPRPGVRGPRIPHVTCLDCGQEFFYDWIAMQRVHRATRGACALPTVPFPLGEEPLLLIYRAHKPFIYPGNPGYELLIAHVHGSENATPCRCSVCSDLRAHGLLLIRNE